MPCCSSHDRRLCQTQNLNPTLQVEVNTPEEHMGDVIGDLNSRRGMVGEFIDKPANMKLIKVGRGQPEARSAVLTACRGGQHFWGEYTSLRLISLLWSESTFRVCTGIRVSRPICIPNRRGCMRVCNCHHQHAVYDACGTNNE